MPKSAAYTSEWPLFLDSFLKLKICGFKSRAAYDGARKVYISQENKVD